ncbi:DNA-directed DNA polymerase [Candidatus Woesearchaeota archaeon]|nr:DNA-directed DNA polymerase [Candidatus Woesearchaeota archaeon]
MGANKIQFYPLDLTYKVEHEKAAIYLFGRTTKGDQICVIDEDFEPYFYVLLRDEEEVDSFCDKVIKISVEEKERVAAVSKTEVVDKKFLGKKRKAVKVFVKIPPDVPVIRDVIKEWDMIESINEYDIHFTRRYLIDKGITLLALAEAEGDFVKVKSKVPCFKAERVEQFSSDTLKKPRVLAFDIETYNPAGKRYVPEQYPIIMLAFYGENFRKVITWKRFKTDKDYIEFVDGELELINKFKEVVEKYKPDILTGYYSDGFDLPYIITRAKKYNINLDIGLDYSKLNFKKGRSESVQITGIVHLDVFKFIIKIMGRGLDTDSYSLDNVAAEILGEKKIEVDIDNLAVAWDKDVKELEKFCEYNLKDANLTYDLCMKVFPNVEEMVRIVGQAIYEVSRMSFSQLVEWYIMKQTKEFNELAPNKPHYEEISERRNRRYKGAFVFEPKPGLYKDIAIFDFRSLYPTIIGSHNIGPSTLNCGCCKDKAEYAPTEEKKYWFCKNTKGFLPSIVENLITHRMRIKEMLKDKEDPMLNARSESLKLLANSFYGYLGFFGARWYCFECAQSVTAYGRHYIHKVIDAAKEKDFEILYSDTDSIFMLLGEKKKEDALKLIEKINAGLPGLMELEYEGLYPSGIFVSAKMGEYGAKKKYALMDDKGVVKITGFETVRRNWSFIAKEVQKEVLNIILKERDLPKAVKYVRQVVIDLKDKNIPNEKVVIYTQLRQEIEQYTSIGPHVAVAQRMKNKGEDVGAGSMIKFIITEGAGKIRDKAKLVEEVEKGGYDANYYINHQVIPSVERIFDVLGFKKDDLIAGDQSKLGEFFEA